MWFWRISLKLNWTNQGKFWKKSLKFRKSESLKKIRKSRKLKKIKIRYSSRRSIEWERSSNVAFAISQCTKQSLWCHVCTTTVEAVFQIGWQSQKSARTVAILSLKSKRIRQSTILLTTTSRWIHNWIGVMN